jgi:hypothetical protein
MTPTETSGYASGSVVFTIIDKPFECNSVNVLVDCSNGSTYYVANTILDMSGTPVSIGTVVQININSQVKCVTFTGSVNGSATHTVLSNGEVVANCGLCVITPTPTVTPTITSTPTMTPTLTYSPTQTLPAGTVYVYSACSGTQRVVVQTQKISTETVGQAFKYESECWTYVGSFINPYSAPSGYIQTNYTGNYFGTISTFYSSCASCQLVPSPTPSYRGHVILWAWTHQCPLCDLVGPAITVYTDYATTTLTSGSVIYSNSSLTTYFPSGRFIKPGGSGGIYYVDAFGVLQLECMIGGGC